MPEPAWSPLVDTHAHIFLRDLPLVAGATHRPDKDFATADYLALLDANDVPFGVIAAPSFLGSYNDYMLRELMAHRRLRGTAIVEPDVDFPALRAMDREGIVGIRYSLRRYPEIPDFTAPDYQRLLRRIVDLDWHVHILAEPERMAFLVPQLVDAGVKLVIDHFGLPDAKLGFDCTGFQAIQKALQTGRTWVKLSAPYRLTGWDPKVLAERYLSEVGPDRLLWGSDCPWTAHEGKFGYRDTIDWFVGWIPDQATRDRISRTALRLYRYM